ncbi:MAG: hypothetical protein AAGG50_20905 [Bacteroidota bacterium]
MPRFPSLPRLGFPAALVVGLLLATAMTRPPDPAQQAETAALTAEAHALVVEMQHTARTAIDAQHPLALLDTPEVFQALTIYRAAGAFRLTAYAPGEGLLTVTDAEGTLRLRVRFDTARILATDVLA